MFLKIVLLLIILYLLYKAFGGSISLPKRKDKKEEAQDGDTLVECSKCGVYITKKEAKEKFGKFYCDECA